MIYGVTKFTDGVDIINTRWPQRRLYHISGTSGDNEACECYVWADCFGDAIESVAEYEGEEGDDDNLNGYEIFSGPLYDGIVSVTDAFNAQELGA